MYKLIRVIIIIIGIFLLLTNIVLGIIAFKSQARARSSDEAVAGLKVELETVSKDFEAYKARNRESEISTGKQGSEIQKLKEDRQGLIEKMLALEKQKSQYEDEIRGQKDKLSDLQQDLSPLEDLRTKLSTTEAELQKAKSELEALKAREGSMGSKTQKRSLELSGDTSRLEQDYTKFVETEWLYNLSKTAEMKAELDKKLSELEGKEAANQKMMKEIADMHYNLAVILTSQKKVDEAVAEYEKVLAINPADGDCHYNLAVLYDKEKGDVRKALEHYRAYVQNKPDAPDAQKVRKWIVDKEIEIKLTV